MYDTSEPMTGEYGFVLEISVKYPHYLSHWYSLVLLLIFCRKTCQVAFW